MADEPQIPDDDGTRSGVCLDGPLAGQERTSRFPRGALLLDRPAGKAWLYDWSDTEGGFRSRTGDEAMPLLEDPASPDNRWRAADEHEFDVWAAPWIGAGEVVDAYAGDDQASTGEVV